MDIIDDIRLPLVVHEGEEYIDMDLALVKVDYFRARNAGLSKKTLQVGLFSRYNCDKLEEEYNEI